jgi:succinate dehydrogenase / fumarate reductase flavoprotein subunit
MQGLADGYFIVPYTIGDYLATAKQPPATPSQPEFQKAISEVTDTTRRLLAVNGKHSANWFHKQLGSLLWEKCGMARDDKGLESALREIPVLRAEFWKDVKVTGRDEELNQSLEYAGRVADFLEFAELLCLDARHRRESCGGHFRSEFQTPDGEALRDDEHFAYVAAWEFAGPGKAPILNKEPLVYDEVHMSTRSYK